MDDKEKIELALKHIREPFYFVEGLTERECEALRLASRGHSIPQVVAPKMGITPRIVYFHLKSATFKISKWMNKEIEFQDLPDLLLKIVEGVLRDGTN